MNNFLSVVWYRVLPPEYGGQKGIALFNYWLGKKVKLTCLCSRTNKPGEKLSYKVDNSLPSSRLQFWNPFVRSHIRYLIRQQSFTHIIIEHPWHAWLGKYKRRLGFTFIVHAHNIEHLRMKARGKFWWRLVKQTEQKAFERADHILFKTEEDKTAAIKLFTISPHKCFIVPYGTNEMVQPVFNNQIKESLIRKHSIQPDERILLFAGTLDYQPNKKALENIIDHILPLLQKKKFAFRLLICGALPEKELVQLNTIPNVSAIGFVPSLQDYLLSADLFINPVMNGSGVQTKNIEAVAAGCTVVTTAFAATGLPNYLIDKKVFISPDNDWEYFADTIISVSALTTNTPERFYEDHHWQYIIRHLLALVLKAE